MNKYIFIYNKEFIVIYADTVNEAIETLVKDHGAKTVDFHKEVKPNTDEWDKW